MINYKWYLMVGTGSVNDSTGWYKLVLLGIRWYRVSKGLVCLYILHILEKVEIWLGATDA